MKKIALRLFTLVFLLFIFQTCNERYEQPEGLMWDTNPGIEMVLQKVSDVTKLQDKVSAAFFKNPHVVGIATSIDDQDNPIILVLTTKKLNHRSDKAVANIGKGKYPDALPAEIENVKVVSEASGKFTAYADPTARFPRPVPIGVSTGHPAITAGTIGCRVKDAQGNYYALSNNHVFAKENLANPNDPILQPGPYDGGRNPEDIIGTLSAYVPISFSSNNTIDAAIAACSETNLGYATPAGVAYGTPNSTIVDATLRMRVQKYGRTTGFTRGRIAGVNATVNVSYTNGVAPFVDQILISPGTFSDGGDSGSLIVTNDNLKNPVGLLFAGGATYTVANPIGLVLEAFDVTIDDGSVTTTNQSPTADFTYSANGLTATFSDQSNDPDGSVVSWNWEFATEGTSTTQNPVFTFSETGPYDVTLTVTDNDGASDSVTKSVAVSDGGSTESIELSLTSRIKGANKVYLTWTGTSSPTVEIFRDNISLGIVDNMGSYTDVLGNRTGTFTYKVCVPGGVCSDEESITLSE